MPLSAGDVNALITRFQTVDQDFARQLAFILFTECSIQESCDLYWNDINLEHWTILVGGRTIMIVGSIKRILLGQPHSYHPYIFKYRYPESFKQRLRTAVKELGIRPMMTLEDLRKGYSS